MTTHDKARALVLLKAVVTKTDLHLRINGVRVNAIAVERKDSSVDVRNMLKLRDKDVLHFKLYDGRGILCLLSDFVSSYEDMNDHDSEFVVICHTLRYNFEIRRVVETVLPKYAIDQTIDKQIEG